MAAAGQIRNDDAETVFERRNLKGPIGTAASEPVNQQ